MATLQLVQRLLHLKVKDVKDGVKDYVFVMGESNSRLKVPMQFLDFRSSGKRVS